MAKVTESIGKEPIALEYLKKQTLELTLQMYGCEICIGDHAMTAGSMQHLTWMVERGPTSSFTRWAAKWYCPAALHQTIEVPLTWWDHLKREHAPAWFLKRWPWKRRVYKIYEMFPEVAWPKHSGHKMNVAILTDDRFEPGPDVVQHPPLGKIWGCLVSAVCAKCRKDIYCYRPELDIEKSGSQGDHIARAIYLGFMDHLASGQCKP